MGGGGDVIRRAYMRAVGGLIKCGSAKLEGTANQRQEVRGRTT